MSAMRSKLQLSVNRRNVIWLTVCRRGSWPLLGVSSRKIWCSEEQCGRCAGQAARPATLAAASGYSGEL